QRVMDCGDAGHILLSKHVAEDLEHFPRWQPYLHELGECGVKHGARVSLVNFYTDEVGNAALPEKFRAAQPVVAQAQTRRAKPLPEIGFELGPLGPIGILVPVSVRRCCARAKAQRANLPKL